MNQDIQSLNRFMKEEYTSFFDFKFFDKVYSFTTENQSGYMDSYIGQDILSICGSGDHFLNLALLGSNKIDTFDINKFSIYHLKLKIASIKALEKENFYDFFGCDSLKYFSIVSKYLDNDSFSFWDYYTKNYSRNRGIYKSRLFFPVHYSSRVFRNNLYLNSDKYLKLKEKLYETREDSYYHSDIYDLENHLTKKYDSIFLSNIIGYQKNAEKYCDFIRSLYINYLKDGGRIYYGYFYGNPSLKYLDFFPNTTIIDIDSSKGIKNQKDYVYVLKKI